MTENRLCLTVILTEQNAKGISFFVDGAAKIDVVKYDLV